ncbi:MAG: type 2 isopentenyl-diphosphate Delta-isomerase [Anaerolineales bacterium]|nr:type 2 isopentenyl-diphosphate Delta-isomerase [Anaerolineales bacterium]
MKKVTHISQRKSDHIRINLREDVQSAITTGLEKYRFEHQALPECNLEDVNISTNFLNKPLAAPILISSMTGGSSEAAQINLTLAEAAEVTQIAMGLGSQRAAIEHPELAYTFQVRHVAPRILLFANLGAIQLNYRYGIDECKKAVEMVEADALILHLNPLQEALQPEGETHFANLIDKIAAVCHSLPVPVIVKEVGWGISVKAAKLLIEAGVAVIDVAGAGGTSWSQVEMYRAQSESAARIASHFIDWGIPTAECIRSIRAFHPSIPIIASGGLRDGIDITKCLALGANLGAMASPFLKAAARSLADTIETIQELKREIQITMFAAGVKSISELQHISLKEI